jgi:formylglycine-generating enzyme required for sulfatase activity/serine/threonine protein kinase
LIYDGRHLIPSATAATAPPTPKPPLAAPDADARPSAPDHEVLRFIGRGAYGEIWLARALTGAYRAIKFVHREDFQSERDFRREFEGMSAFEPISRSHDGFVDILQVGRNDEAGFFYYVMELADDCAASSAETAAELPAPNPDSYRARTLRADLQTLGRLPAADCIELGLLLTSALGALHSHGLSHRDIKPDNIIFVNGAPKLADIGLVAAHGQRSFVGTEGYVPPEGPGGAAADLYSLGKVLYEIAMGKDRLDFPQFASDLHPTSNEADSRLLPGLNRLLLKACAARPAQRYRSAEEMREDLRRLREGKPLRGIRQRGAALLALGVLALAAAAVAMAFHPWRTEPVPAPSPAPFPTVVPTPPPPVAVKPIDVDIRSEPPGAEIFDGNDHSLGRTPLVVSLPPGEYRLNAQRPGWPKVPQTVRLQAGQSSPVRIDFPLRGGSIELASQPPGATVHLNERESGETPFVLSDLPPGAAHLIIQLPGYRRIMRQAEVRLGEKTAVTVDLERSRAPTAGEAWENSLGMKFAPLGGGFTAALMDVWETRVRDFAAFTKATGYDPVGGMSSLQNGDNTLHGATWRQPGFAQTDGHPVVGVSWKDAYAFCDWLTKKEQEEGWLEDDQRYRLPTDLEWSRAVGLPQESGSTPQARSERIRGVYPWGTQWPPPTDAGNYAGGELREPGADWPANWKTVPGFADGFTRTAPVGSFAPNPLGFYDLGGNVWEWCQDRFGPGSETRVLRGGAWGNVNPDLLLSSKRIEDLPHSRSDFYGFRVVLETPPALGSVDIDSEPPGADVFQGERKLGRTPLVLPKMPPGQTMFIVRLDGCQPATVTGQVAANRRLKLRAALSPVSGPAPGQPFENGLGMKFAPVGERLLFSIWETRVQDFDAFCRAAARPHPAMDFEQGPTHPAVNVNRDDAEAFCAWLTARELDAGRLRAGQRYRLPTDREWSRAVGLPEEPGDTPEQRDGRTHNQYPWGKQWPPPSGVGNFSEPTASSGGARRSARGGKSTLRRTPAGEAYTQTAPVGSFAPNEFGLYDLSGNAWEWCADPYKASGALRDWGVLRGGSWADHGPGILLSSYRNVVAREERDVIYGFRCVLDLGE